VQEEIPSSELLFIADILGSDGERTLEADGALLGDFLMSLL